MKTIKVAFGSHWKTIHPGEQHTLVGDLVLSNQFEALVGVSSNGRPTPLGAKSWTINDDFTEYTFEIDNSRLFSDGSKLTAFDYKRSWEDALRLDPKAARSSLVDVLYKMEGFENFESTGEISGVQAVNESTLKVRFKSPFRMALDHLMGNRYSAYKKDGKGFIGTGEYIIEEISPEKLRFRPNPHTTNHEDLNDLEISFVHSRDAVEALNNGTIDVFAYGRGADVPEDIPSSIGVIVGQDALHETVFLNRLDGRLFQKKEHRLAFQFLLHSYLKEKKGVLGNPKYWSLEEQIFLPFQPGRLEQSEVDSLIAEGEKYVEDFRKALKSQPPIVLSSKHGSWLLKVFSDLGLPVSTESKIIDMKDIFKEIYKTMSSDVTNYIFSVAHGDPDGIYHMLGPEGAIQSPMIYSESVGSLLEEARKILSFDDLEKTYRQVSMEALTDVPFVHLGFSKAVALYRKDKIRVLDEKLRRNQGHLHIYRVK